MKQRNITSIDDLQEPITYLIENKVTQLLLHWALWAWKTTFVQQRVKRLWAPWVDVKSPTYTYMNIYNEQILHIDMRRIEQQEMLHELWVLDALDRYDYTAIERPKRTDNWIIPGAATVTIKKENNQRILTIVV